MATRIDVDRALHLVSDGAPLIDVLPESIFRQEHLPGAINVPLTTFRSELLRQFDRDRPIVVYCFDQH
jgi:rhodanese-related sulfurtransferase